MIVVEERAKSISDYYQNAERINNILGETPELEAAFLKIVRRSEKKYGTYLPDLSYIPDTGGN